MILSIAYQFGNPNRPPVEDEYAKVKAENEWTSNQVARFPGRFRGFTLAINLESAEAVDSAHRVVAAAEGAMLLGEPRDLRFGGRGFVFPLVLPFLWDDLDCIVHVKLGPRGRKRIARHRRVRVTAYRGKVRVATTWATYQYRVPRSSHRWRTGSISTAACSSRTTRSRVWRSVKTIRGS